MTSGASPVDVSVVVPWYDDQPALDRLLGVLELQEGAFEVVVADDGSPTPAVLGERPYPVRTVRQEDLGFRASAARHLGVAASSGEVLCFLDADTLPEPGYLAAMAQAARGGPRGTLVVGRRRHADLTGWSAGKVIDWWRGGPGPALLGDPAWLADGYAASDDLRAADDRSYRFVISAVMALPRSLYDAAGGFDPTFVGYGGEDWDLAHRCRLAGADLLHLPGAVAWHDGADLAGREDAATLRRTKDAETLQLAHVLTDPLARGTGLMWRYPHTVVRVAGDHEPGLVAACAASLLDGADAGVWFPDVAAVPVADPRVHAGAPGAAVLQRCRVVIDLPCAAVLGVPTASLVEPVDIILGAGCEDADGVVATVRRTRDLARGDAAAAAVVRPPGARVLEVGPTLEARWGGWG